MRQFYRLTLIIICLVGLLDVGIIYSQSEDSNYLVVRLNQKLLNFSSIDDPTIIEGNIMDFLNDQGRKESQKFSDNGLLSISSLVCRKIFVNLRTSDSLSIGRQGNLVNIPPFWATFRITKPKELKWYEFARELKKLYPVVLYVDPPMELAIEDFPNDSLYLQQYSFQNDSIGLSSGHIEIEPAWDIETGKNFIKVGVFDTGIDSTHEDLEILTGWGYFGTFGSYYGYDDNGHGTAVAGIIGAKRNNEFGIAGIAGGNFIESEGVSLLDFKLCESLASFYDIEYVAASVIDAARSVGSFATNWNQDIISPGVPYYDSTPGYGIHIGNHSYGLRVIASFKEVDVPIVDNNNTDPDGPSGEFATCQLCKEAFLFSLQNGVVNVVSRGNIELDVPSTTDPYHVGGYYDPIKFPAGFDDSWVISVGASGTDGMRLIGGVNTGIINEGWFSPQGRNIDLIAPGTKALVTTTKSTHQDNLGFKYKTFNGTSASAPHVSGLVGLLLSKYNKNCYSQINLDPSDIEYILEQSATDVDSLNYDVNTGWGRLNANQALKMIDFPVLQIVHPHDSVISITMVMQDTISLHSDNNISNFTHGPISSQWSIESEKSYVVERLKYVIEYSFSDYILSSTELIDVWVRHSQTNSLGQHLDTILYYDTNMVSNIVVFEDTFRVEPMASIVEHTDSTIKLEGYYYHFIKKYEAGGVLDVIDQNEDFWYPIDPNTQAPKMAYSIYIRDSSLIERYDFDCDSLNLMMDTITPYLNINNPYFKFDSEVILFPNPGNELIKVMFPYPVEGTIMLFNTMGELLMEQKIEFKKLEHEIVVNSLSNGIYLFNFRDDNGQSTTKKWVKQ